LNSLLSLVPTNGQEEFVAYFSRNARII